MNLSERSRIEQIAGKSLYAVGVNSDAIQYSYRIYQRHFRRGSILELGPAEGLMTALLNQSGCRITAVDGSFEFCADLKRRFPNIRVIQALFEEFEPEERFDNIVLGHVLEHVADPMEILVRCRQWLAPAGRVFANVPNSRSLHRQAAVLMGLLPWEEALNEMDLHHGHRRVFNPETFRLAFIEAGLSIEIFGGFWLKPVSNRQIESTWTKAMLGAFMVLGERYPDVAGEIYIVATHPTPNEKMSPSDNS